MSIKRPHSSDVQSSPAKRIRLESKSLSSSSDEETGSEEDGSRGGGRNGTSQGRDRVAP